MVEGLGKQLVPLGLRLQAKFPVSGSSRPLSLSVNHGHREGQTQGFEPRGFSEAGTVKCLYEEYF